MQTSTCTNNEFQGMHQLATMIVTRKLIVKMQNSKSIYFVMAIFMQRNAARNTFVALHFVYDFD